MIEISVIAFVAVLLLIVFISHYIPFKYFKTDYGACGGDTAGIAGKSAGKIPC